MNEITLPDLLLAIRLIDSLSSKLNILAFSDSIKPYTIGNVNTHPAINILSTLETLKPVLQQMVFNEYIPNQNKIIENFGLSKIWGDNGIQFINDVIAFIRSNGNGKESVNKIKEIHSLLYRISNQIPYLKNALSGFDSSEQSYSADSPIIEIVFDEEVAINDFGDAKEQMEDWNIIIQGFAKLTGGSREDFEIISILKASPTRYGILIRRAADVAVITGLIASIYSIQSSTIQSKLALKQLEQLEIGNAKLKAQFIDSAKEEFDKQIQEQAEALAEKKIKETGIDKDEKAEAKTFLTKSIKNTYTFISKGGTINVYINSGEVQEDISAIAQAKDTIKLIKGNSEFHKKISEHAKDEEPDEDEEEIAEK